MATKNALSVTRAAGLAARAIARLEEAAEAVHTQANGVCGFADLTTDEMQKLWGRRA